MHLPPLDNYRLEEIKQKSLVKEVQGKTGKVEFYYVMLPAFFIMLYGERFLQIPF